MERGLGSQRRALSLVIVEALITEFVAGRPAKDVYANAIKKLTEPDIPTLFCELRTFLAMQPIPEHPHRMAADGRSASAHGAQSTRRIWSGRALPCRTSQADLTGAEEGGGARTSSY
jgi:hypothetical protein